MSHRKEQGLLLRWISAITAILLLVGLSPQQAAAADVWQVYKEAQRLENNGQYTKAIAKYNQTLPSFLAKGEYGNAGGMHRRIGDNYVKLGDYDAAVANWDKESEYYLKAGRKQDSIAVRVKADKLRSKVSLYYETSAGRVGNTNFHGAVMEPKNGALLGAYTERDENTHGSGKFYTDGFPALTGKNHAAYLLYFSYGMKLSSIETHIREAKKKGTGLEIAIQPLSGLGVVQDDDYLRQLAKDMAAADIPILLRFANEMNGKWVPWYTTPEIYKEKFRLVANVMHQEAKGKVAMVWAPGSEPEDTIDSYYPGDAYVDWIGVSLYSIYNPVNDPLGQGLDRTSHVDKLAGIYNTYASRKPIFIAEGGISYMYPEKMQDKTGWAVYKLKEFYGTLPMLYPKVKAVFWFNSNYDASRVKYYQLSANAALLQAYKDAVSSPYYLGAFGEESKIAYLPVGWSTVPAATLKLGGYVKTWSPTLAKVTYDIGGKTVGTASAPPWKVNVDFSPYKGKTIDITVKAFDGAGKLATKKVIKTTVQ